MCVCLNSWGIASEMPLTPKCFWREKRQAWKEKRQKTEEKREKEKREKTENGFISDGQWYDKRVREWKRARMGVKDRVARGVGRQIKWLISVDHSKEKERWQKSTRGREHLKRQRRGNTKRERRREGEFYGNWSCNRVEVSLPRQTRLSPYVPVCVYLWVCVCVC